MRILALDPGERVGWARADIPDDGSWSNVRHGITDLQDMALAVHRSLTGGGGDQSDYDLVIVERWALYPHMAKQMIGSTFPSAQFVGMVRLSCWLSGTKLIEQGAGCIHSHDDETPSRKAMKKLRPELYELVNQSIRHDDGHDLDALSHLWHWTFKNRIAK